MFTTKTSDLVKKHLHQDTVIHLTCDNDHENLRSILEWGAKGPLFWDLPLYGQKDEYYGIEWEDPKKPEDSSEDGPRDEETPAEAHKPQSSIVEKRNPVMISAQQGFTACTSLLYQYGFRIPQIKFEPKEMKDRVELHERTRSKSKNEKMLKELQDSAAHKKVTEGDEEEFRFKHVVTNPDMKEDQVKRLLLFKAYADPHYLSLATLGQQRLNDPDEMSAKEIWALQQLDPLRRAFDLAEKAERFTTTIHGMSELKGDYKEIKLELETYTASLLTQCSDLDHVKMILEHNPKDEDEDEDDDEEQNWQKALLEGRKDFVGHPFYQQYFFKKLYGETKTKTKFQGVPVLEEIFWNLCHCPKVTILHFWKAAD